jgi:glucose-6-phosphate isomerase
MDRITLDISLMFGRIPGWELKEKDLANLIPMVEEAHKRLHKREGDILDKGIPMTGWLDLPFSLEEEHLLKITEHAKELSKKIDAFVSVGIGGSYLGIEATIMCLKGTHYNQALIREGLPEIYFLGTNMDPDYYREILAILKDKRVAIHVISKSGTTLETAVAFRVLRRLLKEEWGRGYKDYLVISTDRQKGALRAMANALGFKTYDIPEDVGGRFSVLTDPLLFSIAMAGIDLVSFWKGFRSMAELLEVPDFYGNMSMAHALLRYVAWQKGKAIEVVATNSCHLYPVARWMEQLFPESEGHKGKGLWVSPSLYTEKLHANGQMVQEGPRNMIETFLVLQKHSSEIEIPKEEEDLDGLNFLCERGTAYMGHINRTAIEATAIAHYQGGVPSMSLYIPERTPYFIGQLYFLMEKSVALSGYLLGHNPFVQPGVEAYKKNMYALLGKPGTEGLVKELEKLKNTLSRVII